MLYLIKEKNICRLIVFSILLSISNKIIICENNNKCFEYSCEECDSPEYGNCTKCRKGWTLLDGTCPCLNSSCALCTTGLYSLNTCHLCKNGYIFDNYECYCNISNCEQCGDDKCLLCKTGYFYDNKTNKCEKQNNENNIKCYDKNCNDCFSELEGACVNCKEGFITKKGKCNELIKFNNIKNTCPYNYYKSGNYCLPICDGLTCDRSYNDYGIDGDLCNKNSKCLLCIDGKLTFIEDCFDSYECSKIKGCLNCISNNECIYCNRGYFLLDGLCYKCIEGCSICSNNETCDYCLSGYELTLNKKCNLTYNFDFNIDLYNKYKKELIYKNCSDTKCISCSFRNGKEYCDKCVKRY